MNSLNPSASDSSSAGSTRTEQLLHHVAMDVTSPDSLMGSRPDVLNEYLYSRAASIAGGTSEVQRTIVAERVLLLPRGH
jgi:alkylation response protein AidB-like acyl-CoA dehydrogenase